MGIERSRARVLAGAGLGAGAAFAIAPAAQATDFPVTNTTDSQPGSLRTALDAANANMGADTITFSSSLTGTINLQNSLPTVTGRVDIAGPASGSVTVYAGSLATALRFAGSAAGSSVKQLTLADGSVDTYGNLLIEDLTITEASPAVLAEGEDVVVTLRDSSVTGNTTGASLEDGAGLTVEDSAVDANSAGIDVAGGGTLTLLDSSVSGNLDGGGVTIDNTAGGGLSMDRATVSGNDRNAGGGGGIRQLEGYAAIYDSTISGNTSPGAGAGIATSYASTNIVGTTVSGNVSGSTGGGIEAEFADDLSIYLSTFSGNSAPLGGGGIAGAESPVISIASSTFTGNNAGAGAGGGLANIRDSTEFDLVNTIVANSGGGDLAGAGAFAGNFNLIESAPFALPGANNFAGVDPQLGPLAPNGGPTLTHKPGITSPVLDKGFQIPGYGSDQRGMPSPIDLPTVANGASTNPAGADIGSVELAPSEGPQASTAAPQSTPSRSSCKGKTKKKKCRKKSKKKKKKK